MDKRVPEDIQLVGFDDVMISTVTTPQITTIHQPVEEMAELCVEYITKSLKNELFPRNCTAGTAGAARDYGFEDGNIIETGVRNAGA